jgi:predicted DNA-binding transcriptional regulator AlpA
MPTLPTTIGQRMFIPMPSALAVESVAIRYGVTVSTVRRWVEDGTLPKPQLAQSNRHLWLTATLIRWERDQAEQGCQGPDTDTQADDNAQTPPLGS